MFRFSWLQQLFSRRPQPIRRPIRRTMRPMLEALEDRITPAPFYVTSAADDNSPGTLR